MKTKSRIFLSPPWTGEEEQKAVQAAFASGYVAPCGPMVDEFDRRLSSLSKMYAAAVSSGTAALDLLMHELGIKDGDVVIASSLTFVATVGPAYHRGAKIVFVDTDPITGTISIPLLKDALNANPQAKCVIAADIYGQCSDYDQLESVCTHANVAFIVDAAESVGAKWKGRIAGNAGKAAIYSFNGNKIITTSGGGAVLSNDDGIVSRAKWRAQQARENFIWYEHKEVGFNYRMSNLLGALGCAQLDRLDEIIRRKKKINKFYRSLFSDAQFYPCVNEEESTNWLSVVIFESSDKRDIIAKKLSDANIETRPVWKPLHMQEAFKASSSFGGSVSEDLFARGLCLPSGAAMGEDEFLRIAEAVS
jgi:dTDP-4-amino-4,6-dideoxygalactose transaminase